MKVALALAAAVWLAASATGDEKDRSVLLEGVAEIAAPGLPGAISVFSASAFAVIAGGSDGHAAAVVAAARLGKGRVVALGHDGYFGAEALATADTGRLMENAVRWASARVKPVVGCVGASELRSYLDRRGFDTRAIQLSDDLKAIHALTVPLRSLSDRERKVIGDFVRSGGGLITGGPAWGFLQLNPGKSVADYPFNPVLLSSGLAFADGMVDRTSPDGYLASHPIPRRLNALVAVDDLLKGGLSSAENAEAVASVMAAALSLPPGRHPLSAKLTAIRSSKGARAIPTHDRPLTTSEPLGRLALALDIHETMSAQPSAVRAHPAADIFPGRVAVDVSRALRTVVVDTTRWGWRSLGVYAPAGEVVTVRVPMNVVGAGFSLQIGCHTDTLWHLDKWQRAPAIVRRFVVSRTEMRIASAFGGLVYLDVPSGFADQSVTLEVAGAVLSPRFVLGKTDTEEWRRTIRHAPAPWAELEGERIILSVPSRVVRTLEDPSEVLGIWDRGADIMAELTGIPLERRKPERFVNDEQISAGYMHSGYPIMTFTDVSEHFVNAAANRAGANSWGQWHELGHNHQQGDWTFEGTGEVTNNVLTLYVFEKLCGMKWTESPHPALSREKCRERLNKYLVGGARFDEWKRDPFLALYMYIQLIDGFGWEPLRQVLAEYRGLKSDERPRTDAAKRDQWMVRYSKRVGRDLSRFFSAWGVPVSDSARSSVNHLPIWMPADFPQTK